MRRQGPLSKSKPARGSQAANAAKRKVTKKKVTKKKATKKPTMPYSMRNNVQHKRGKKKNTRPAREYGQME